MTNTYDKQSVSCQNLEVIFAVADILVVMDATMAPAIFKPEKNLVFFRIKSRVP